MGIRLRKLGMMLTHHIRRPQIRLNHHLHIQSAEPHVNNPFDLRIRQIRRKPREPSILVVCDPERKEIQIPCRSNELVGGEIKQRNTKTKT